MRHKINKNICYLYQDQYPWDVRAEKITDALADNGYRVHIVSRNRDGLPLFEQYAKRVFIHRISINRSSLAGDLKNFPAFFSPFWINRIWTIVNKYSIDLIIVRDLPLSPAALFISRTTGVPVIMDMAENYPALIKSTWRFKGPSFADIFLRNPYLLTVLEKYILPMLDGVIVVSRLSAKRIRSMIRKNKRIWVVSNTPQLEEFRKDIGSYPNTYTFTSHESSLLMLYVGFIESHRGLQIPIKSLPALISKFSDIKLIIAGDGSYRKELEKLAVKLKVEKNVIFTGWVPHAKIPPLINAADICLIPHFVTEHTDTTYPNKIFDYMALKKPVVASNSRALSEIINLAKCGVVYEDQSTLSFIQAIQKLEDDRIREYFGFNGWNAVQNKYNWNIDKEHLLKAVDYII